MKIKVKFFDSMLMKSFLSILSTAGVVFSFFSILVDVENDAKIYVGISLLMLLIITYLVLWFKANRLTKTELTVDNSKVIIKVGDIFEEPGFKVIAFNEYLDTIVDNKIISENSLNGLYINNKVTDVGALDTLIDTDETLREKVESENPTRSRGKKRRFKLGTLLHHNDYFLMAFAKFDNDNRAYLYMNDLINCLLNFWNEIDILYSGKSVSMPLHGSGITRIKEYTNITDQELLELLLWSFKISRIKFTHPSVFTIVIHDAKKDKINFYKLKGVI